MKRSSVVFVVLLGAVIVVPMLWVLWLRAGPTAAGPAEDPVVTWNCAHEALTENAATFYKRATDSLSADPPDGWAKRGLDRSQPVSRDLIEWVDANADTVELIRQGAACKTLSYRLSRTSDGLLGRLPHLSELREIAKFLALRARVAATRADELTIADSLVLIDQLGRQMMRQPTLIQRLVGIACMSVAQGPMTLEPFTWPNMDPNRLEEYSEALRPLDRPYPSLADAFVSERADMCYQYLGLGSSLKARILVPRQRYYGEVYRVLNPLIELSGQPVEARLDASHPLAKQLDEFASEVPARSNIGRLMVQISAGSLRRVIELNGRIVTMQRGNRTARAVFEYANRTGAYPETLDFLGDAEFGVDPYTKKNFMYRRTEDGFTLYCAGIDRDDDGGAHHGRFGAQRATFAQPNPVPDGDYVFWPIPDATRDDR